MWFIYFDEVIVLLTFQPFSKPLRMNSVNTAFHLSEVSECEIVYTGGKLCVNRSGRE